MKFLTNTKKTRYRLAIAGSVFLAVITIVAIVNEMQQVAITSIAGFLTILSSYILGDSYRKSDK